MRKLEEHDFKWETIKDTKHIVMRKYFGHDICKEQECAVFTLYGVPAASIVFDKNRVSSFHLKKELITIFDAGPQMRYTFYKKWKRIDMSNATNKNDFLLF